MKERFLITEIFLILGFSAFIIIFSLFLPYLKNFAKMHDVISEISRFEQDIYTFYIIYGHLPGDMPNATKHWTPSEFTKKCDYMMLDRNNQVLKKAYIFKGFNGNGDGVISTDSVEGLTTDTFSEVTAVGCHLKLAGFASHKPVVLRDYNNKIIADLWYWPVRRSIDTGLIFGVFPIKILKNVDNSSNIINQIQGISRVDNARLSSQIMMAVDKKIDDGRPGSGRMRCNSFIENRYCCDKHVNGVCESDSSYIKNSTNYTSSFIYNSRVLENFGANNKK